MNKILPLIGLMVASGGGYSLRELKSAEFDAQERGKRLRPEHPEYQYFAAKFASWKFVESYDGEERDMIGEGK